MVDGLQAAVLPFKAIQAPIASAGKHYSASTVSFNCSLNGDLNLRILEILACGGCLLTDPLSDASGLGLLLQDGKHYVSHGTPEEAAERARFLLANPAVADGIARAGQGAYREDLQPGRMARHLLKWIAHGRLETRFTIPPEAPVPAATLQARLACYERLQELQRQLERPRVLIYGPVGEDIAKDARDLHRLELHVDDGHSQPAVSGGSWDCIVKPRNLPLPPDVRATIVEEI